MKYRAGILALAVALVSQTSIPAVASDRIEPSAVELAEINLALKNDPMNAALHYRAALAYEISSVPGSERREVSKAGYAMAVKADPSFWPARVQLGLLAIEDKDSLRAQRYLLDAALLNPTEPTIFYALARAAYVTGELGLANAVFHRASILRAPSSVDEYITGAAILARTGQKPLAEEFMAKLAASNVPAPPMVMRAMTDKAAEGEPTMRPDETRTSGPVAVNNKMGMVDIIILRRNESKGSSTGINLLEALTLQLGGSLLNSKWTTSRDQIADTLSSNIREVTREITATIPSVTYSLNIANARDGWSTVQAQQALLIYDQQTSKVSVGSSLTYATDGQLSSSVATKDAGLSLEIKPQFLEQGAVKVSVSAILEEFVQSAAGSFRQSVQTDKSTTDVTAELRFGETILIASGEATINSRADSRTPLLAEMPVLGQLFQNKRKASTNTSLLILLTLRPRGSEQLPDADNSERSRFQLQKNRLLEQLHAGDASALYRFVPDYNSMSYKIENPARKGDVAYLNRTGAFSLWANVR